MRKVLIAGTNKQVTDVIERLVNEMDGYTGRVTNSNKDLNAILEKHSFDILLLGAGYTREQETEIRSRATKLRPEMKVVEHYGGGSGLLASEIRILFEEL